MDVMRAEANMRADGAPGRDLSGLMAWRDTADPENLELIAVYSSYLYGQHAGMTDALSLPAVIAAMDILRVEQEERPELARRLIVLHGLVRERERAKEKEKR